MCFWIPICRLDIVRLLTFLGFLSMTQVEGFIFLEVNWVDNWSIVNFFELVFNLEFVKVDEPVIVRSLSPMLFLLSEHTRVV